jgi:hypothetical protein
MGIIRGKETIMDRDIDNEEDATAAPQSGMAGMLKLVAHYAVPGLAPVLSVAALVVAIVALTHDGAEPAQTVESAARIENLSASLVETKNELESLKFTLARERSLRAEERKKADERETKIIQHVTRMQTKQKIAPTLEEQLKAAASVPPPVHAAPVAAPVSAPIAAPVAETHVPAAAASEPKQSVTPAPVAPAKKGAAAPVAEQTPAQVKALKAAIDKFNQK